MVEPENEGSNLEPVTFYPDDPQPVSREQPYPTLAPSISADPPLVTVPTSSVTSAPSSVEAIPTNVMKNVEVLTWPNKNAPGGISTVYLVGTTHVSKVSMRGVAKGAKLDKWEIKRRQCQTGELANVIAVCHLSSSLE